MAKSIKISLLHSLGAEGARQRLQLAIGGLRKRFDQKLTITEERWEKASFFITVRGMAQSVSAQIDFSAQLVEAKIVLPWILAGFAGRLEARVKREAQKVFGLPSDSQPSTILEGTTSATRPSATSIVHRVPPRKIASVSDSFYPGMFGDFSDVITMRMEFLNRSRDPQRMEIIRFYKWVLNEVHAGDYADLQMSFLKREGESKYSSYLKYIDPIKWFEHKLKYAWKMDLHRKKSLNILDIGTGPGHFLLVAKFYGHTAVGTELSCNTPGPIPSTLSSTQHTSLELFDTFAQVFRTSRLALRIKPFGNFEGVSRLYDLVTILPVSFDRTPPWTTKNWGSFLNSVNCRLLCDGGSLFMTFNKAQPDCWKFLYERSRPLNCKEQAVWIDDFRDLSES